MQRSSGNLLSFLNRRISWFLNHKHFTRCFTSPWLTTALTSKGFAANAYTTDQDAGDGRTHLTDLAYDPSTSHTQTVAEKVNAMVATTTATTLAARLGEIEGKIGDPQTNHHNLSAAMGAVKSDDLQTQIDDVNGRVDAVETKITAMQEHLNDLPKFLWGQMIQSMTSGGAAASRRTAN